MPTVRSEREQVSVAEKAKQDRRIARAIQQGWTMNRLTHSMKMPQARIKEIAAKYGLEIATGARR